MKRLPKDPRRRREWTVKMKRDNWKPTVSSKTCEVAVVPYIPFLAYIILEHIIVVST